MRRFRSVTNAFCGKVGNQAVAMAFHFMNYNFRRVHLTLKYTPAMKAGIADHVWSIQEIIERLGEK